MSTASYFVNWSYQTSKACTVLVGESTEMFPASKATTLESTNKSLARPHQSSSSSGSGNEESGPHSRPRRSVDGHASVSPSVFSMDSSTAVDMHELITTPPVSTFSLEHGVTSASDEVTQPKEGDGSYAAFVSSSVNVSVKTGELIDDNTELGTSSHTEIHVKGTTVTTSLQGDNKSNTITNTVTESVSTSKAKPAVEQPPEDLRIENESEIKKDESDIAYDPESMQGDSYPSLYSYGIQKLQYLKLLTRLNAVLSNESVEKETDLNRLEYLSVNEHKPKTTTETTVTTTKQVKTETVTTTVAPTTTEKPQPTTDETVSTSTMKLMTTHIPHVETTQSTPSATNPNHIVNNITRTTERTNEEYATVNIATESKSPDVTSNPKHVLINLTISADDAENASYKPLYSLTVTVPTVGDSNEIPTVKITPMEMEPTAPTNFNNPAKIETTTKFNQPVVTEADFAGSCECSCPACDDSVTDDFYSDYSDKATTEPPVSESTTDAALNNTEDVNFANSDTAQTEKSSEFTTDSIYSTTELADSTTDYTTESDLDISTTVLPKCECPQVKCPPILILEGEVVGLEFDQR